MDGRPNWQDFNWQDLNWPAFDVSRGTASGNIWSSPASRFPDVSIEDNCRSLSPAIRANHNSLLLAGMLCCLAHGCTPAPEEGTDGGGSEGDKPARAVCIIASGDTHGWIIPCGCTSNQSGGLLRRGTYIDSRSENADVVVVDVGGAADGTAAYQRERFRAILHGEKLMNLTAHNLGAAEAQFGRDTILQLQSESGVQFISANSVGPDGEFLVASHVLAAGGQPSQTMLITGVLSPDHATDDIRVLEPAQAVLSVVESVTEHYDRLVVLAYLPVDQLRQLAETLPEADVIIGGPTGQALSPEKIGRTIVLSATNKGKFLADVLFSEPSSEPQGVIVEMSTELKDSASQQENLSAFRALLTERDFTAAESGLVDMQSVRASDGRTVVGTAACRECHSETNDHWATTAHSHAWQRLLDEGAHVDPYCQHCHTTGYGLAGGFFSLSNSQQRTQVGCESCHGPSSVHAADSSQPTPFDAGGICLKCHDPENSPHFQFDSYWEKVRHE